MRSALFALPVLLLLSSCGPAMEAPPAAPSEVPPPSAAPPPLASAPAPATPPATVEPDKPSGADAARDAELAKVAASTVDVYANSAGRYSPDGKYVVFRSTRDGLPQLYIADAQKPAAPATRLLTTTERVISPMFTRDGKAILFLSDKGANEAWNIFRVDPDGKNLTPLTQADDIQREPPHLPEGAPETMIYVARSFKEATTRLFTQAISGGGPKLVYTDPAPGSLLAVSRDGKLGLFKRDVSFSEAVLLVVDLTSGAAKQLYPAAGKQVGIHDAAISPDGKRVFVSTDGGGEQALLLALDAATGEEKARYVETKPRTANLDAMVIDRSGALLAAAVNAGNHAELRLLDAKTLKPKTTVTLPLGTGLLGAFSDDGGRLSLTWTTPNAPADLFEVDTRSGKVRPLRSEPRAGLEKLPAIDASITEVASFDGTKVPVNLYLPRPLTSQRLSVVVMVHGGPAASSSVAYNPFVRFFASQGYAVVEPNVRGSTGFGRAYEMADNGPKRLDAVKDMEAVARWAAAQPWADAKRLIVWGGSYGGYMVLMGLTRQPDLWAGGVDLVGPSSWRSFMATTSGEIREILQQEFGRVDKDGAFLDSISPLADTGKIKAPLFVYQGEHDPRVPRPESDQIVRALRERKVPVEYMVAANEGHSVDRRETRIELCARALRFLEANIARAR